MVCIYNVPNSHPFFTLESNSMQHCIIVSEPNIEIWTYSPCSVASINLLLHVSVILPSKLQVNLNGTISVGAWVWLKQHDCDLLHAVLVTLAAHHCQPQLAET